jgi:hypothetical protein
VNHTVPLESVSISSSLNSTITSSTGRFLRQLIMIGKSSPSKIGVFGILM